MVNVKNRIRPLILLIMSLVLTAMLAVASPDFGGGSDNHGKHTFIAGVDDCRDIREGMGW
jgi:hypothetical protein